jgi:HD-GYP domain-containing protein (c-di-GMP phosphodiesterase class II)
MFILGDRTRLGAFVAACAIAAIGVSWIAFASRPPMLWWTVAGFGVLAFLAESFAVTTSLGTTYSVTFIVTLAAGIVLGPAGAIVASIFGTTGYADATKRPPLKHLFNAAQLTLATVCAAWMFHAVAGAQSGVSGQLLGAGAAAGVNFAINTGLVAIAVGLSKKQAPWLVWREQYLGLGPVYLAYAALGLLFAILYLEIGWGSLIFFLVPLLVARGAFHTAISLQDSFDQVVTTLVAAVEQKDAYTGGHAERVASLAEMVARAHGLSARDARAIRYAALMHDVGKLAVHNAVLQKDGKLTDHEHAHMRRHPEHGVELASGIELLGPVLDGIRHHHERWDGAGYPDGLAGEAIPLAARIITVSDAFDAMTSTRAYRPAMSIPQAFAELDRCAGTQFDPSAVASLRRAVEAGKWVPAPEAQSPAPQALPQPQIRVAHAAH